MPTRRVSHSNSVSQVRRSASGLLSAGGRGRGSEDGSQQSTHEGGRRGVRVGWTRGTQARYGLSSAADELGDIQNITSPYRPAKYSKRTLSPSVLLICCLLLYFSLCSDTINTYKSQTTTLMQRMNCRHKQKRLQYQVLNSGPQAVPILPCFSWLIR